MNGNSPSLTPDLESLTKERDRLNQQIWNVEALKRKAAAERLVGKCFRYRNSYSCPKDDSERWWLYQRVVSVNADGWMILFGFQRDKDGKLEVEETRRMSGLNLGEPITLCQFQHAWKVTARMANDAARAAGAVR